MLAVLHKTDLQFLYRFIKRNLGLITLMIDFCLITRTFTINHSAVLIVNLRVKTLVKMGCTIKLIRKLQTRYLSKKMLVKQL